MQNFTVTDRPDKRFEGEFQVNPEPGHTPNATEEAYRKRLQAALDELAADATKDKDEAAQIPADVLTSRKRARDTAIASLRSSAESNLAADAAIQNVEAIQTKYQSDTSAAVDGPPKFETVQDNSRFPGYFVVNQTAFAQLTTLEQDYLKQVRDLLNTLAEAADKDQDSLGENFPKMMAHKAARENAASRLRWDVNFVGGGSLTAEAGSGSLKSILKEYHGRIEQVDRPKLQIDDRPDARFLGDFLIKVSDDSQEASNRDLHIYAAQLREILRQLAKDHVSDQDRNFTESVKQQRADLRQTMANALRQDAETVSKGLVSALAAANNASSSKGRYIRDLELASGTLFKISILGEDQNVTGVKLDVNRDLMPPNNVASPEKQALYTAILAAQTVIKTVCHRIESGEDKTLCGRLFGAQQIATAGERAKLLRNTYLTKLAEIAKHGLEGPHTALAQLALTSMRNEFVAHEGPRIKNSYVCRLGLACGIAAGIFLLAYTLIATGWVEREFWKIHKPFFLAGTGAAIGTWLSFSIREVELSFDRLGVVEADLLDPAFRVLFVVALTIAACLLFWTGVMNIEIGNLKTTPGSFGQAGSIALLVGVFCGLSERALATSISGRAATFVKGL
jgi:hypothetical protein